MNLKLKYLSMFLKHHTKKQTKRMLVAKQGRPPNPNNNNLIFHIISFSINLEFKINYSKLFGKYY